MGTRLGLLSTFLVALLVVAQPALAGSHLWRFNEFYSSPDHSVQFIEMQEIGGSDNETAISNHWYKTNDYNQDQSELLGSDLPFGTANKKFLVGTESYAALPGVPAPDYVLPDGFFDPDGDLVHWWTYQIITLPPGAVPTDGVQSATVVDPDPGNPVFSTGVNSPTNFAGETGTVVLPTPHVPIAGWGAALAGALVSLLGWRALRDRTAPGGVR